MATSPLLPSSSSSSSSPPQPPLHPRRNPSSATTATLFATLLLTTCLAVATAAAFAFLFFSGISASPAHFSSFPTTHQNSARPLRKLPHPVVLLISSDGFRFGYQFKTPTPSIGRLVANGTEAFPGLIPVFPTLTFPSHYSIATGLYPESHGIINNRFVDPADGAAFTQRSHEPRWWLGEPLWATVANNGLKAATYFWVGSEVSKGSWTCPPKYCRQYDSSVPFEERVDAILSYFDLPGDEIPSLMTLYFEYPDQQGHKVGPDDPEITAGVATIDRTIGRLIEGMEKRGIFEDVTTILVGDHGMVGTCDGKLINLEDLARWIDIPSSWVQSTTPLLAITPPDGVSPAEVVAKMNEGLSSGQVENGKFLKMYLKEDLPERLHYRQSDRIPPVIGLPEEAYKVQLRRSNRTECGGAHGYDNAFFSMRTIFVAHGPQFEKGRKVPSFENVEIYNLVTAILQIQGAPNNGSLGFANSILLPTH